MAKKNHLPILKQGLEVWNRWREENPDTRVDLRGADLWGVELSGADFSGANLQQANLSQAHLWGANLRKAELWDADLRDADLRRANLQKAELWEASLIGANLSEADLSGASLRGANLSGTNFREANLRQANIPDANLSGAFLVEADLSEANLSKANLEQANFSEANLSGADLWRANLGMADLSGADLSGAKLREASLVLTDLSGANLRGADIRGASLIGTLLSQATLTGCSIYGVSAWNVGLEGATQKDLIITTGDEAGVVVDDLRIAQFIYLLLDNQQIRDILDTITAKSVLILGRFTDERKTVLNALREELRQRGYLPILFDYDKPASRDLTETIMTLAGLSRFIIADVTDAKSIPQELTKVVPNLPSVPVRLLMQRKIGDEEAKEYALLEHFKRFPWVIDTYKYQDTPQLLASLSDEVIKPAEAKVEEQRQK